MERIKMIYNFNDDDKESYDEKTVSVVRNSVDGLHDYDVCEMFMDFMNSIGFSEENIFKYFNEE